MRKENGFGLLLLFSFLLIIGLIAGEGWLMCHRSHLKTPKVNSYQYHFSSVPVDTSKWVAYQPFQGFHIQIPTPPEWNLADSGAFSFQPVDGSTTDLQHQRYIQHKGTTLFTSDLETAKDMNANNYGDVTKGARIQLEVTVRDNVYKSLSANNKDEDPANPCKTLKNYWGNSRELEELEADTFKACQIKLADNQYEFDVITSKFHYTTELVFGKQTDDYKKNYYISLAQELVKHYLPV